MKRCAAYIPHTVRKVKFCLRLEQVHAPAALYNGDNSNIRTYRENHNKVLHRVGVQEYYPVVITYGPQSEENVMQERRKKSLRPLLCKCILAQLTASTPSRRAGRHLKYSPWDLESDSYVQKQRDYDLVCSDRRAT
jgi:hypothetical protein